MGCFGCMLFVFCGLGWFIDCWYCFVVISICAVMNVWCFVFVIVYFYFACDVLLLCWLVRVGFVNSVGVITSY